MKRRSKIAFGLSLPFLCFFLFGITNEGQHVLRGNIPSDATHMRVDDIYMGAGIAPVAWGLFPFLALVIVGLSFWRLDRQENSN